MALAGNGQDIGRTVSRHGARYPASTRVTGKVILTSVP